ncbi:MAG: hypothetical protein ABI599_18730 [Flavobacteriales bacterium]
MEGLHTRLRSGLLSLSVLGVFASKAQDLALYDNYNTERERITANSMLVLGGWAIGNMAVGAFGALTTPAGTEANYFHQMNIYWNVVNLGIALPAYVGARKHRDRPLSIAGTFDKQRSVENIYLINVALDVAYTGAGSWMRESGNDFEGKRGEVLSGFGNSLMLQGGFLLVYDLINYTVHTQHWKKHRGKLWEQLQFNGTSIQYTF